MRIALRPTVLADLAPLGICKLPHRIKALTAEVDGAPVGAGGLVFMPDGTAWATLRILERERQRLRAPDGSLHRLALLRAARRVLAEARAAGLRVIYAKNDPAIEGSARFLARLGFVDAGCDVWMWEG